MSIKILWFVAYIVIGLEAFQLLSYEDRYLIKRLYNEYRDDGYDALKKYSNLTRMSPECCTPWKLTMGCIIAIVFVLLWPIVTICCVIWYPIAYRIAIKTES